MANIKCLLGKHNFPVKNISGAIINQVVKCENCSQTIEIKDGEAKIIKN